MLSFELCVPVRSATVDVVAQDYADEWGSHEQNDRGTCSRRHDVGMRRAEHTLCRNHRQSLRWGGRRRVELSRNPLVSRIALGVGWKTFVRLSSRAPFGRQETHVQASCHRSDASGILKCVGSALILRPSQAIRRRSVARLAPCNWCAAGMFVRLCMCFPGWFSQMESKNSPTIACKAAGASPWRRNCLGGVALRRSSSAGSIRALEMQPRVPSRFSSLPCGKQAHCGGTLSRRSWRSGHGLVLQGIAALV